MLDTPPAERSAPSPLPPAHCGYCAKDLPDAAVKFCPHCGYPQNGTEEERGTFLREKGREQQRASISHDRVNKARNALFWVAGLNMIPYIILGEPVYIVVGLVISLMFVGLALWSRKQPYPAILTALALYVLLILLAAIENPVSIFSGIIVKVLVLSALFYALRSLKEGTAERKA
jgi:hypothetical protein